MSISQRQREKNALKGLNGMTAIPADKALIQLEEVQRVFSVFGVHIRTGKGQERSCPLGSGHRPAMTIVRQLAADNPKVPVFVNVTVA